MAHSQYYSIQQKDGIEFAWTRRRGGENEKGILPFILEAKGKRKTNKVPE